MSVRINVSPKQEMAERPRRVLRTTQQGRPNGWPVRVLGRPIRLVRIRPLVLLAWAFVIWTEMAPVPPGRRDLLVLPPTYRLEYATFEECQRARDALLPFLAPTERATGCQEVR